MKLRLCLALVLAASCLVLEGNLGAGDKKADKKETKTEETKEIVVEAELINADLKDKVLTESFCKTYTYKMTQGRNYQIDMRSTAFDAFLRLENPKGVQVASDDDSGGMLNARIIYRATETGDFQICAMSLGGGSTGKFTLIVKDVTNPAKLEKALLNHTDKLAANDPVYKGNQKHKLILFAMDAGKTYQIDMKSTAFDSYLYLEDPNGKLLDQNDDGGGYPNARIIHKATATGKYRIVATHFGGGGLGEFTVTVRSSDGTPIRVENKDGEPKKDAPK